MAALFHCMTTAAATAYPSKVSEARIRRPSNASLSTSLGVHHDDTTRPQTAVPLKGRPPTSLVFARRARGANLESQGGALRAARLASRYAMRWRDAESTGTRATLGLAARRTEKPAAPSPPTNEIRPQNAAGPAAWPRSRSSCRRREALAVPRAPRRRVRAC